MKAFIQNNRILFLALILIALVSALPAASAAPAAGLIKGVDISSLPQVEAGGGIFTHDNGVFAEGGVAVDALEILAGHGIDFVRLRVWHSPAGGHCGLGETLSLASRAKALGLGILLDIHYSDTWADPGHQHMPAAWAGLSPALLADSVYRYTKDVVSALRSQGTTPDWVQTGNEITCGLLWDEGRVCGTFDTHAQWDTFASLIKAGIRGVHDAAAPSDTIKIMIHVDRGGDNPACVRFFDNLLARGVEFGIIGLSFYPWWHGTLGDLASNMNDLALRYGKSIVVVETAYPWTLGWNDDTHNIIGMENQLHKGYPASVQGQKEFLTALIDTIGAITGGKGLGLFYWEPAWISAPSTGSPWENLCLFDFAGEILSSIEAFESLLADTTR